MVVLSITIGTKAGKLLLCRDFSDISRTLVEDCVSSLPQLIRENQEHTFVEHNNLRLNYLPLGNLFLMSINDKNSNILEDVEVLRSVQDALNTIIQGEPTEDSICSRAIDIIFALDDLISLGHRNIIGEFQLTNALEMDSANERLAVIAREKQEKQAKKKGIEFQKQLRKQQGMFSPKEKKGEDSQFQGGSGSTGGNKNPSTSMDEQFYDVLEAKTEQKLSTVEGKKTLKLGTNKKKKVEEEEDAGAQATKKGTTAKAETKNEPETETLKWNPMDASVLFKIKEEISILVNQEGKLKSFEVKGEIGFTIGNPKVSRIAVMVESENKNSISAKVPPAFNKKLWSEDSVLMPRDEGTSFQTGLSVMAVKYTVEKAKGNPSPVNFAIWPDNKRLSIEAEFNSEQTWLESIENLEVEFTLKQKGKVSDKQNSSWTDSTWSIPQLGGSGVTEATISIDFPSKVNEEDLFPLKAKFIPKSSYAGLSIAGVKNLDNDEDIRFEVEVTQTAEIEISSE